MKISSLFAVVCQKSYIVCKQKQIEMMDGIATLWPEQMTKSMVIEKNKQTNKQNKQQIRTRKIHQ